MDTSKNNFQWRRLAAERTYCFFRHCLPLCRVLVLYRNLCPHGIFLPIRFPSPRVAAKQMSTSPYFREENGVFLVFCQYYQTIRHPTCVLCHFISPDLTTHPLKVADDFPKVRFDRIARKLYICIGNGQPAEEPLKKADKP